MNDGFRRASAINPCPICHKPDWCSVSLTSGAVICMRLPSDRPTQNGGWLHGKNQTELPPAPVVHRPLPGFTAPDFDAGLWWKSVRLVRTLDKLQPWADQLGLPVDPLDFMGACTLGQMLAFPMYDGQGKVCGIRTRFPSGDKRSITGSRSGVFLPCIHLPGESDPVICEGPTDATAALALGFEPIGRPSCRGCEQIVVDTCKRFFYDRITVCADTDNPGIEGARKLADMLRAAGLIVRLVTPCGHKDLRDWFKTGVSKQDVDTAWSQAEWR